jgi:hypothetical protein
MTNDVLSTCKEAHKETQITHSNGAITRDISGGGGGGGGKRGGR